QQGKHKEALAEIRAFHHHLCAVRVLDPACGSGNFLYVTLEHMKRLEGEVLNLLHDLGESQGLLQLAGVTVDPHQFLGLEINPRAARIAEMVLWIGYLQWHYRTHGSVSPPEPVLRDFRNIQQRDALIDYDREEFVTDEAGRPVTRWDGVTYRKSPITGEPIPDESAQIVQMRYVNPRKAEWPQADYIVGNPPFIGAATMRRALGDGYVDAVRRTWPEVPESADFVMYWWHIAGETVRAGTAKRFGFITTNSIKQTFNRRVVQAQLEAKNPLSLAFAIPDHPWVDAADGAAVRIAMTVGASELAEGGIFQEVRDERTTGEDEIAVSLLTSAGRISADLRTGADLTSAKALCSNLGVSSPGVKLHGAGFIVTPDEARGLGLSEIAGSDRHIRVYRNGRDLTDRPRGVYVIDLYGMQINDVFQRFPAVYQWILERVRPEREAKGHTKDGAGYAKFWWLFGKPRPELRKMLTGLSRYIATVETMKHRLFTFLDSNVLPDNRLVCIATDEAARLGTLSSRVHARWSLAAGGTLEDRPVYTKTLCFDTFPFPDPTPAQAARIRDLAEQLDAHRKRQQALHPELTLTGMYNVLEKLRAGDTLTPKERTIHEQGLVSVLRELHDALDTAVFEAYGWGDLAAELVGRPGATTPLPDKPAAQAEAEEELLARLVALNTQRATEEARGHIRWLRPDYQNPGATLRPQGEQLAIAPPPSEEHTAAPSIKATWPKHMREQVAAVRGALAHQALTPDALAANFKRTPRTGVLAVLEALEELGMVVREGGVYRLQG
ncbi:MAG: class I SAM-dependent DNA methyltransferase, partial [Zoogloeaceae bacterium]|nr:class I SAM-dependent DNA methyltransferase [Zoogloeaceae bacterium]